MQYSFICTLNSVTCDYCADVGWEACLGPMNGYCWESSLRIFNGRLSLTLHMVSLFGRSYCVLLVSIARLNPLYYNYSLSYSTSTVKLKDHQLNKKQSINYCYIQDNVSSPVMEYVKQTLFFTNKNIHLPPNFEARFNRSIQPVCAALYGEEITTFCCIAEVTLFCYIDGSNAIL